MVNSPTWVSVNTQLGYPAPGTIDSGRTFGTTVYPSVKPGTIAQFRDVGATYLGTGAFIFLPGVTSTVAGDVVSFVISDGGGTAPNYGAASTRWVGGANTGYPLAIATAAVTGATWGWYQITGAAIVNISGTVVAGNSAYWNATATISTATAVGGKQVLGMRASSAQGVPDTGKAIFTILNPVVQSQIT